MSEGHVGSRTFMICRYRTCSLEAQNMGIWNCKLIGPISLRMVAEKPSSSVSRACTGRGAAQGFTVTEKINPTENINPKPVNTDLQNLVEASTNIRYPTHVVFQRISPVCVKGLMRISVHAISCYP